MKKYLLVSIFTALLTMGIIAPTSSTCLMKKEKEHGLDVIASKLDLSDLPSTMQVRTVATITKTTCAKGKILGIAKITYKEATAQNGTKYAKVEACYKPVSQSEYGFIVQTPTVSYENLRKPNDSALIKGDMTRSSHPQAVENPVRTTWDGNITFISTSSTPLYIKYDHPDNGPYSNPTYDIPPNEKDPKSFNGYSVFISHIPEHIVDEAKQANTFLTFAENVITPLILILLGVPEAIGTKAAAALLAVVDAIITGWGLFIDWVIENQIRTELDDGWAYMGGYGSWSIFRWCWVSFGAWRDWHWNVIWIDPTWETGYDGSKDPWWWYDPFLITFVTVYYHFSEDKGVWSETKTAGSAHLRPEDYARIGP